MENNDHNKERGKGKFLYSLHPNEQGKKKGKIRSTVVTSNVDDALMHHHIYVYRRANP